MRWLAQHRWGVAGAVGWGGVVASAFLIPDQFMPVYVTCWIGAVALLTVMFTVGYVLLSKPSRDESGQTEWRGEWYWLLALVGATAVLALTSFVFRLSIPPSVPTARAGVIANSFVFLLMLWLTLMWVRRQVKSRRAMRDPT